MSYHNILIPLDGSKLAEKVLDYLSLFAAQGAHIHLLSVVTENYSIELTPFMFSTMSVDLAVSRFTPPSTKESPDPMREYLYSVGARLVESGYHVTLEIVHGEIIDSIVSVSTGHYDAILMATHGRTGLSKLLMGSITEGVLHQATCPVIVVPVHPEHVQHFSQNTEQVFRVLIPLDGTPESESVLPELDKLLAQRSARIILLRVAHIDTVTQHDMKPHLVLPASDKHVSDVTSSIDEAPLQSYLEHIAVRFAAANREIITRVGCRERVDEILFFANLYHVDLIAMATHGRSGLIRLLLGSVTESVLRHTPCPILISRINGHEPVILNTTPASLTKQ